LKIVEGWAVVAARAGEVVESVWTLGGYAARRAAHRGCAPGPNESRDCARGGGPHLRETSLRACARHSLWRVRGIRSVLCGGFALRARATRSERVREIAPFVREQSLPRVCEKFTPRVRVKFTPRVREKLAKRVREKFTSRVRFSA
jgi:hypothetical protein